MKSIWQFEFTIQDHVTIQMPRGASILSVQMQRRTPCIWAEVDTSADVTDFRFRIFGTDHPIPEEVATHLDYIGTFQMHSGDLVFHLYHDNAPMKNG